MKKTGFIKVSLIRTHIILSLLLLTSACDLFKIKSGDEDNDNEVIVASVGKTNLYASDIGFIGNDSHSEIDSAELVNRYIQTWVKKQLMIKEAGKNLTLDEAELNRKLLDYRYALIVYEFEKSYVDQNLDKQVPLREIQEYYNRNKENFSLREIIVRTNFIQLEKNLPQKRQVERLLKSDREEDSKELRELSSRYANNYFLEDSTWIKFDDIILNTPLARSTNNVQTLKSNKLINLDDDNYSYYFKILEYKLQDQVPPLEFVKDEISKIIVNKRRVALAEKLHQEVFNNALEKNEFKIYE